MPSQFPIEDIIGALERRERPTITTWNRLEGRPRTDKLDRALKAEVRDPLWMLTRQWQLGEFRGSDAGSPISVRLRVDTTQLTKYQPAGGATQPFGLEEPFETKVERRPQAMVLAGKPLALDLRLAMGRQWLALVAAGLRPAYVQKYAVVAPDPTDPADAAICADPEVWEVFAAVASQVMDGWQLYAYLQADPAHHAYDGIAGAAGQESAIDAAATKFLAWFQRLIAQPPPSGDDAWNSQQLEYQFDASAQLPGGNEKVYSAGAFWQDRLDWYCLDVDASQAALPAPPGPPAPDVTGKVLQTTLPVPVSFAGMANTRWWTFEDQETNFGDVDASTTDLGKLMFMEFALVYANDWFVIPLTLPSGSIANVRGVAVSNTFGEHFWVQSADAGPDSDWQRWSMFTVNTVGKTGAAADTSLVLLPTVAKLEAGPALEAVTLVRDEVANMVWGVEQIVPLASGVSGRGLEQARQLDAFLEAQANAAPQPPPAAAPVRYQVMSTVPENWIPFIPVHVPGSNRTVQLQRAAMPRIIPGVNPVPVQPRTALLRPGLDVNPPAPYFVHEEEVTRAGTTLRQEYTRTRWTDGRVHVWLRVVRETGRGEGSSGLRFDELVDA